MRAILPWLLIGACADERTRFTDAYGAAACDQEQACDPESWRLFDGEQACREEASATVVLQEVDPCATFHPDAARACVRAIEDAPCDERVLHGMSPDVCASVYVGLCDVP